MDYKGTLGSYYYTGERGYYDMPLRFNMDNANETRRSVKHWKSNALWLWKNRTASEYNLEVAKRYARAIRTADYITSKMLGYKI